MGVLENLQDNVNRLNLKLDLLIERSLNHQDENIIIGSKEISVIIKTTVNGLRKGYDKFVQQGYPITKRGREIIAVKKELHQFCSTISNME